MTLNGCEWYWIPMNDFECARIYLEWVWTIMIDLECPWLIMIHFEWLWMPWNVPLVFWRSPHLTHVTQYGLSGEKFGAQHVCNPPDQGLIALCLWQSVTYKGHLELSGRQGFKKGCQLHTKAYPSCFSIFLNKWLRKELRDLWQRSDLARL